MSRNSHGIVQWRNGDQKKVLLQVLQYKSATQRLPNVYSAACYQNPFLANVKGIIVDKRIIDSQINTKVPADVLSNEKIVIFTA